MLQQGFAGTTAADMKLGLVTALSPLASPAATLVDRLLPGLTRRVEIHLLPHAPEQVANSHSKNHPVRPQADLPSMLAAGEIDLPIYFAADNDHHAAQIRYIREFPGLLLLLSPSMHRTLARITEESGDIDSYRDLLIEEYGAAAREWPERFAWRSDRARVQARLTLDGILCQRSLGVLAPPERLAGLRARYPDVPFDAIPDLDDPDSLVEAVLAAAEKALASPRTIAPPPRVDWPSVEVLVVGYNCKRIITPALESIAAQDYPSFKCTLVDNASSDGTGDFVRANFPDVHVIDSPENLGFAGGNNLVLEHSDAKYVVLFNQDAIARPDFLRELVRVAERDSSVAAVGGKMLMLRCPTIFNSTGVVMNEGGFAVDRQIGEKDEDPTPVPESVFGVCGGAKLLRSSTIREVGGFDETFFMYSEDVDLCWRMRLAGKQVMYAPLAVVHHDWFGDLDDNAEQTKESQEAFNAKTLRRRSLCERNRMQCILKNLEWGHLLQVLNQLRKYDRLRCRWADEAIARGENREYLNMVKQAIRRAWTWNLRRAFSLWKRRRTIQRSRVVSDSQLSGFVDAGVTEPAHIGDLEVIHDRHCAKGATRLSMGVNDQQSLGPGWYGPEPVAGEDYCLRWNKGRSWAYLAATEPVRSIKIRLARGPVETQLGVVMGRQDLGSQPVSANGLHIMEFPLPHEQHADQLIEIRLDCSTFRPSDLQEVGDHRVLGLQVAEVWLE
ncbi:MAG: glycosyltransferase family 2 protein [Planctomycetota bacterium]|nr:glycosyltransferase family 2 protein [Planctomycetota bacterium]